MVSVTIAQDADNYLKLTVLRKLAPYAWDTWDGNRLRIRVDFAIAARTESYDTILFSTDLEAFRDELLGDVVDDSGLIALMTMDGVVDIIMERKAGIFVAECSLRKVPDGLLDAHVELRVPVHHVPRMIRDLDTILATYPVIQPAACAEPEDFTPPSPN